MQVAVNCAIATRGISGSSRGLHHILDALGALPAVSVLETWPKQRLRRSRIWNATAQAAWDLRGAASASRSAEVLISPCNVGRASQRQRHVLVLHDTMVLDRPDLFDRGYAIYARMLFGFSLRCADVILVPSDFSKNCVEARWPKAPPILVAPWPLRINARDPGDIANPKHILMVGSTEPLKRHIMGILAVKIAREMSGEELLLTVLGPRGRSENEVMAVLKTADPEQAWTSRRVDVPRAELELAYRKAWLLLQPSQMEGYGLPVGEATSIGVPVVHSGFGALSEIAPAAVASPEDPASYASEICSLLDPQRYSEAVSTAIAAAGRLTAASFTKSVAKAIAPDLPLS